MKQLAGIVLAWSVLSCGAAAQFTQFQWTLSNPNNLIASLNATTILVSGGTSCPDGSVVMYSAVSPVDAFVSAHLVTFVQPGKGSCSDQTPFYGGQGQLILAPGCASGDISFAVRAGESMNFGLTVHDGTFPGDAFFSLFIHRPYWLALGGALPGASGSPTLVGEGVLKPHEPFAITLDNAAPAALAALFVGTGVANVPFKGGILVPTPSQVILGLITDAQGELMLGGTWPNTPFTGPLFLQGWIVDAVGPQGFAASNAVAGTVY